MNKLQENSNKPTNQLKILTKYIPYITSIIIILCSIYSLSINPNNNSLHDTGLSLITFAKNSMGITLSIIGFIAFIYATTKTYKKSRFLTITFSILAILIPILSWIFIIQTPLSFK